MRKLRAIPGPAFRDYTGAGPREIHSLHYNRRRLQIPAARAANLLIAGVIAAMCLCVLASLFLDAAWAATGASLMFVIFVVVAQQYCRLRERLLLSVAAALTMSSLWFEPGARGLIDIGLQRAAYLAAFMILLGLLREAAETSRSVLAIGRFLTQQPAGRRYAAVHTGGIAIGVILNFGVLSLLGPLIQRGVRAGDDNQTIAAIRERRQIAALSRGFSWTIAWSPTAIVQALVPTIIIGSRPGEIAMVGACLAVCAFFVGWLEDRIRFRHTRARLAAQNLLPPTQMLRVPWTAFKRFALVCGLLGAATMLTVWSSDVRVVSALMLVAPLITLFWIWYQYRGRSSQRAGAATWDRARRIGMDSVPRGSPEAVTLSIAGYCGIVAAGLLAGQHIGIVDTIAALPPVVLYVSIPAFVALASNLAMPPMFVVTFLGTLLIGNPGLQADPTLLALAFTLGWVLNLTASPFGATALVLSRVTGIPGTTLTWRWNGVFSLLTYGVVALTLGALAFARA